MKKHIFSAVVITAVFILTLATCIRTQLTFTDGQLGAPLDDAWIHIQFANNLSAGNGFSYNPNEPTPGSTAPLWTVLLAIPAFFVDGAEQMLAVTLVLSALFLWATGLLLYGLTVDLTHNRLLGTTAAIATITVGRMAWAGWSGMEATAFAAVTVAAVWAFTRHGLNGWVGLLFGLASQLRPEGHALVLVAGVVWLIDMMRLPPLNPPQRGGDSESPSLRGGLGGGEWLNLIKAIGTYTAVTLPYMIFSLMTTGRPLANTFYAKASTEAGFSVRTLVETVEHHWWDNPISFVLLIVGLLAIVTKSKVRLVGAWVIVLPILTAFIVDFVWHHGRYTLPLIPFQMILAVLGIEWLSRRGAPLWSPHNHARTQSGQAEKGQAQGIAPTVNDVLMGILCAALIMGSVIGLPKWARMLGQNTREIIEIDVALGHWLRENTAEDALIAVDDIGAIGVLSERRIFDLNGLISPQMWPIMRDVEVGLPRNQATTRLLADVNPDYLAIFPTWHHELANTAAVAQPIHHVQTETRTMIANEEAFVYRFVSPYGSVDSAEPLPSLADFSDMIRLSTADISPDWHITLTWQAIASPDANYDIFVHAIDEDGVLIGQSDGRPYGGLVGTDVWRPGDVVTTTHSLYLDDDPAVINVGLYNRKTGVRLQSDDGDFITISRLHIENSPLDGR